jgi:asparagine synthetase B (glutamine-hydrolysing)
VDYGLCSYILPVLDDGVGMAGPVESRLPFLDPKVIRAAGAFAASQHTQHEQEKWILREAFKGLIPEHVRTRGKQPFLGCFIGASLQKDRDLLGQVSLILSQHLPVKEKALRMWMQQCASSSENDYLLHYLLTLYYLITQYVVA